MRFQTAALHNGTIIRADDDGRVETMTAAEFVESLGPESRIWTFDASRFVREVFDLTGHWVKDVREAELVWRVLHPELHPKIGAGFPRRSPVELARAIVAEQADATPEAWARVKAEARVDDIWREVTARGIRVDEARLRELAEAVEAERRESIERHGIDLTSLGTDTERWLRSWAISVPGGLSHDNWDSAKMPASSAPQWAAFTRARGLAQDAGKVVELLDAARSGRVHPAIPAMAAVTGRQATSGPSLQNLAARMRPVIMADEGMVLVGCDLHAVEPHVAAWLSGDETLVEHLRAGDPYVALAEQVWPGEPVTPERRKLAKTALLAILYGQGAASTANRLGINREESDRVRAAIWTSYPRLHEWTERVVAAPSLVTGLGRPLPRPIDRPYAAVNYAIQGTAKDIMTDCTLAAADVLDGLAELVLPVHDELVVQCKPEHAAEVQSRLAAVMTRSLTPALTVLGEAEVCGERWSK